MANKLGKVVAGPTPAMAVEERKWRAEDDLRTITRACEIQRDSSRMREVKKLAGQQIKSLEKVRGSRK